METAYLLLLLLIGPALDWEGPSASSHQHICEGQDVRYFLCFLGLHAARLLGLMLLLLLLYRLSLSVTDSLTH